MAFDQFKRKVQAATVYGAVSQAMENPPTGTHKDVKGANVFTSPEQQDKMKNDLRDARFREYYKGRRKAIADNEAKEAK